MLSSILSKVESALAGDTPAEISRRFFGVLATQGATYLQTRLYRRPVSALTNMTHWNAGGVLARVSPASWVGSSAFNYICFEQNPLLGAIREGRTRYRFSDFADFGDPHYANYWDAMSEAGIADALCATSYGPDRTITSLHLGFDRRDFTAGEARSIHMAGLLLTERLMEFAEPLLEAPALTSRERDAMAFVADGHTDWQIAERMKISEPTVRFHLGNARRKLGAVNRAQAVARFATYGLL